jgi:hypothetical protein
MAPMREPVVGAQMRFDIAEQPRAILGFERGVAEVWSGAAVAHPSKISRYVAPESAGSVAPRHAPAAQRAASSASRMGVERDASIALVRLAMTDMLT